MSCLAKIGVQDHSIVVDDQRSRELGAPLCHEIDNEPFAIGLLSPGHDPDIVAGCC